MAQPHPTRQSPILSLLGAVRDVVRAGQDTVAAADAGKCVVCGENPVEGEAKICPSCADDGAEVARRAARPFLDRAADNVLDALSEGLADILKGRR